MFGAIKKILLRIEGLLEQILAVLQSILKALNSPPNPKPGVAVKFIGRAGKPI